MHDDLMEGIAYIFNHGQGTVMNNRRIILNADAALVAGTYIVGSTDGANVSFSPTPRVHANRASAAAEAERLAKAHPGKEFLLVKIEGSAVSASAVLWK